MRRSDWNWKWPAIFVLSVLPLMPVDAQEDFDAPPIAYGTSSPDNRISRLQERLDAGEVTWKHNRQFGYLKAVLDALEVPLSSQVLVYSKTSLQLRRISPRTPRAIYFNDDVYIGFCQSGDVIEISTADPELGGVFYTLDQRPSETVPTFKRHADNCLVCHATSRTEGVPGHLVRSLFVDRTGYPVLSAGSLNVNHTTPFEKRWGGWYVTGTHGKQTHRGNLIVDKDSHPREVDNTAGQNVTSLADLFAVDRYLTPHSDIAALMVLEHQVLVHNRITKASYTARQAVAYNKMLNEALENPADTILDSTTRRIQSAGDKLVDALLMVDEAPLTAPVRGTSGFAEAFADAGPRDAKGRSLRELNLTTRLLKYPCSYLIYSEAFRKLPPEMNAYFWPRLKEVLSGTDQSDRFAHLSANDRQAISEILRDTVPDLPDGW